MPSETLKERLRKDRPMTSITVRMPQDVVESMKRIAPLRGLKGYQTLLKLYLSEGLRRDELLLEPSVKKLIQALVVRGVSPDVIEAASKGLMASKKSGSK